LKHEKFYNTSDTDPRIAFFDRQAETWDLNGPDVKTTIHRLEELGELLALRPGQDLLEVGCGTGQITAWLADQVKPGKVTGIDFSEAMLIKARSKAIDARFMRRDVCTDSLGQHGYDVVLCFHSFPHFRDKQAALKNIAQALRPLGSLIILHLKGRREVNDFHDGVGGAVEGDHLPNEQEWDRLLEQAGLRRVHLIDRKNLFFLKAILSCD